MTSGVFGSELEQFQSTFDAVDVTDTYPADEKPKRAWKPPFKVGEKDEAIISDAYLTRPPWEGDDGVYLRVALLHEEKDEEVDFYLPLTAKSERQAAHVKKTLKTLGYDLDDPSKTLAGLEDHCHEFEGKIVEIYTKAYESNGRTRYNYYVNKIVGDGVAPARPGDDIPF